MSVTETSSASPLVEEGGLTGSALPGGQRFPKSPGWKHIITSRSPTDFRVVTDLTNLAGGRRGHFELGGPSFMECTVPSHDFRVYFPSDDNFAPAEFDPFYIYPSGPPSYGSTTKDYPRVAEGVRMMYSFRRECPPGGDPWVIRHAGPILELEDTGESEVAHTRFTAFDPWAYMYQRPVLLTEATNPLPSSTDYWFPGEEGVVYPPGTTGDFIVCDLLRRLIDKAGTNNTYIDAGEDFGGTAFWNGTIETTYEFVDPVIFPRGLSVGEAWERMVDTGTLDIVLTPIWDPLNRPGYCAELSVLVTAPVGNGSPHDALIENYPSFHWGRVGYSLTQISRLYEGRERANRIRGYAGGTGAQNAPWVRNNGPNWDGNPVDIDATTGSGKSATRYGESWHDETFVRETREEKAFTLAMFELFRRREGHRTIRLSPTPEYSPRPFQDYMPGSYVAFSASNKLRQGEWWIPNEFNDQTIFPRIFAFDLDISDDSLEKVSTLDVALDIPPGDTF